MQARPLRALASLALLLPFSTAALAQAALHSSGTVAVAGHPGQVPVVQINGRPYVDVDALARLAGGSLSSAGTQFILTLAPSGTASPQAPRGFSPDFLRAGIEQMSAIREWRIAIVNAVQNNSAVTENWVSGLRRTADNKLALASAAAHTDADRKGLQLLQNEFTNMQQLSENFLNLNRTVTFTPTTAFDNNPLDQKILACARAMTSMAANNAFLDDPNCH